MTAISPVLDQAYCLLRTDIYRQLDEIEYLVQFDDWNDEQHELVRKVIPDLTTVIRGLIAEHESSTLGQCKKCGTTWPCMMTESIYALVKDPVRVFYRIVNHVNRL
ncbi:hypothetical protein [Actinophytocola sediminis]